MWNVTTKKEKIVILVASLIAVFVLIGAFSTMAKDDKPHYAPGTYLASAEGIGPVLVAVEVSEDSILQIDLDVSQESPDVGGEAAKVIADQIIAGQSVRVDEIAGATATSKAVKEAVDSALRKATLAAEEADHKAEIDSLSSNLDELKSMVDSLTSENESLTKANAEKEQENESLRNANASQKLENDDLKAENERLAEMNSTLEKQLNEKAVTEEETEAKDEETTKAEEETKETKVAKPAKETQKKASKKEEKQTEAEQPTDSLTEEIPEETSHDLVSMTPVEEVKPPVEKTVKNEPAFVPFYVGTGIISSIQEALENLGYYGSGVDGLMGPGTQDQLTSYQEYNGLEVTGTITPETVSYLLGFEAPGQYDAVGEDAGESNATMADANLLEFTCTDAGLTEDGTGYQVNVAVKNLAPSTVTGISFDVVWYNQYGQRIATTNTVGNGKLKTGKSENTKAILEGEELIWSMASMGVGAYTYKLAKPDENGFSTYHVNLLTGAVQGS